MKLLLWVLVFVLLVAVVWLAACRSAAHGAQSGAQSGALGGALDDGESPHDDCMRYWVNLTKVAIPDRVITDADTAAFHKLCQIELQQQQRGLKSLS